MSADSLVTKNSFSRLNVVIPELLDNDIYCKSLKRGSMRFLGKKVLPGTAEWVAQRLDDSSEVMMRGVLLAWVHPKRRGEVTEEKIVMLKRLLDDEVVEALDEMAEGKK